MVDLCVMRNLFSVFLLLTFSFINAQNGDTNLTFDMMRESGDEFLLGEEHYKNRRFEKAGDHFAKSFEILKNNKEAAYNAACAYSLAKMNAKALEYCEKALKNGQYDFSSPDLYNISGEDQFQTLLLKAEILEDEIKNQSIAPIFRLPKNYDENKSYPLIIAFHGFNSNAAAFSAYYEKVAQDNNCILMLCTGSKIIKANAFAWTFEQEEYERIFDEIEMAKLRYKITPGKIILTGIAQGGFMTYALGMIKSEEFCGLLPVGGLMPQNISMSLVKNKKVKVYSIIGLKDNEKVITQNEEAETAFKQNGNPFKLDKYNIANEFPVNRDAVLDQAIKWLLN